jgi:hypothetical protein
VLIEGVANKGEDYQMGKTDGSLTVVFPKTNLLPGEMICVEIEETKTGTLHGVALPPARAARPPASTTASQSILTPVGREKQDVAERKDEASVISNEVRNLKGLITLR